MEYKPHHNEVIDIGDMQFIYKERMTIQEWLDTRQGGIGGSDIGVVMGVNPWTCRARLFFEKLGLSDPKDLDDNDAVHWGRLYEDILREQSQYWDWSDDTQYMRNYWKTKKRNYSHVDFPFFAINKNFPWLRMNVDGLGYLDTSITQEDVISSVFDGDLLTPDHIVEIKRINERATEKWDIGFPYGYVYQTQGYKAVFAPYDIDESWLFSQVGGNKFEGHRIPYDEVIIQELLEETYEFSLLLEEGHKILKELPLEEAEAELWNIAPYPEGKKDYIDFLSEKELQKIAAAKNKVSGTDRELEWALLYKEAKAEGAIAEAKHQKYQALLMEHMTKSGSTIIDFGSEGKVSFNKRIYVNIK